MSHEAEAWAFNLAPVPMDAACECRDGLDYHGGTSATSCTGPCTRKGCACGRYVPKGAPKPSPTCAAVLIGLANHADPDGTDCYPSTRRLVRYTRLSERTVQNALDRLEAERIIVPGDPAVVAAKIKRGDRRTKIFDLDMGLIRDDLPADEMWTIAREVRYLRPLIERHMADKADGVQPLHPVGDETPDNDERGATAAPRDDERGAAAAPREANGVQQRQERGAAAAPKQSLNRTTKDEVQERGHDSVAPAPQAGGGEADTKDEGGRKGTQQPLTTIPDDFAPSVLLLEWAKAKAPDVDLATETEQFIRWHQGKGTKWRIWDKAWQNWMSKAQKDQAGNGRGSGPRTRQPANGHWEQGDDDQLATLFQ